LFWSVPVFNHKNMVCLKIDSGIDLIVKTQKEIFPNYHCFWSQRIYYIKIAVCFLRTWCWKYCNENGLSIRTYTYKIEAAHLRLWSGVYQRWRSYKYSITYLAYLQNHCGEERLSCNCSDDFTSWCDVKATLIDSAPQTQLCSWLSPSILLLEINIGLFTKKTTLSTTQF